MVKINSMKFGEITIDNKTYYSDMTVWWDGRIEYREKSHVFGVEEFSKIAAKNPEMVVIGTGVEGVVNVSEDMEALANEKNIQVFVDTSPKAIEMFNAFQNEGKKVVAVIHSTC
ncbi:MAG: hypothetical protein JW754_00950 [Candidatus Aenigmarchaeota archaeon]|nr:hypothetical protein [Candidatus Aenigmarchaeota archaeon]